MVLSELLISHARRNSHTLDYVIFLFAERAFCLIHVIRHGDTMDALKKTSVRRRREHSEDIRIITNIGSVGRVLGGKSKN